FSYCVQVHAACRRFGQKNQVPTITWATDDFSALRLQSGSILTIGSLKLFIQEQYKAAEDAIDDLCLGLDIPNHFARDMKDIYNIQRPGYSFLTEPATVLPRQYLWDKMISSAQLKLLAGALYKVTNSIIEGYQQHLFTGYKGRFGAERLREIIQHKAASSTALHTKVSAQELRQALVAFLDQYTGHSKAVSSFTQDLARDVQSGHSTQMAVTHYAVSDQDLPSTNRYDVHVFMLVSEAWFKVLLSQYMDGSQDTDPQCRAFSNGQSVEYRVPATHEVSNTVEVEHTTVVREVTEVYSEAVGAKLLPLSTATFQLLHELRGSDSQFLSPLQGAAVQTIISNPGYSFLVILPTG
ncbi:hypothetical protein V1504DRAFT_366085, partial [Lipomyces starkeyi]